MFIRFLFYLFITISVIDINPPRPVSGRRKLYDIKQFRRAARAGKTRPPPATADGQRPDSGPQ